MRIEHQVTVNVYSPNYTTLRGRQISRDIILIPICENWPWPK